MSHRFRISPDAVANRVGDQIVLIHIKTDRIFSLNQTAARLWELLLDGGDIAEIRGLLLQEFDVPEHQLNEEIDQLLITFQNEKLIAPES